MIAHNGGIDEMAFVLVPLIVFLTLQWLSRRKARGTPDPDPELGERLEHHRRLAGGLIPDTVGDRPKADDPPEGTVSTGGEPEAGTGRPPQGDDAG